MRNNVEIQNNIFSENNYSETNVKHCDSNNVINTYGSVPQQINIVKTTTNIL